MEEQKPIELSIHLPDALIAQLSRLTDLLLELMAAALGERRSSPGEAESNPAFDGRRFQRMASAASAPGSGSRSHPSAESAAGAEKVLSSPEAASADFSLAEDDKVARPGSFSSPEAPCGEHSASAERQPGQKTPPSLTAEAVSSAFRRDDRRYDSGFPLYAWR